MMKELKQEFNTLRISAKVPWFWTLVLVMILNGLFLVFAIWVATLPREILAERVRDAFASSELIQKDYLPFDDRRGWHQYDDCLILQMITNKDNYVLANALGPLVYNKDETYSDVCSTLNEIVVGDADTSEYLVMRYTRYWHGYNSISAALLLAFELADVRNGLRITLHIALLLLVLVAGREQRALLTIAACIAAIGAFFGLYRTLVNHCVTGLAIFSWCLESHV